MHVGCKAHLTGFPDLLPTVKLSRAIVRLYWATFTITVIVPNSPPEIRRPTWSLLHSVPEDPSLRHPGERLPRRRGDGDGPAAGCPIRVRTAR